VHGQKWPFPGFMERFRKFGFLLFEVETPGTV